jgi:NAD(P)-dependent dehydrogenase (short-subunit alcohol dehydrogenase family)
MVNQQTLIIGASSQIAKAIAEQIQHTPNVGLILISRDLHNDSNQAEGIATNNITKITVKDYQADTIEQTVLQIKQNTHASTSYNAISNAPITRVFICHGLLHSNSIQPEKRLEDFSIAAFQEVMTVNAITPMLWIQHLTPILAGSTTTKIVVFSARVGSISDNRLGGWYSYRASKSALNMLLKTAAIELARRAKNIKIIAFHPGTTDTSLSKPFQKNVSNDKLFSCEFVAKQLLHIVEKTELDGEASYLDWQGKSISW